MPDAIDGVCVHGYSSFYLINRKNAFSFSYIQYVGFLSRLNIFVDIFFAFLLVFWHIEDKTKKEDFKNGEFGILYKKNRWYALGLTM